MLAVLAAAGLLATIPDGVWSFLGAALPALVLRRPIAQLARAVREMTERIEVLEEAAEHRDLTEQRSPSFLEMARRRVTASRGG